MICRLKVWHHGDGSDFVPAGTPVEVFGWSAKEYGMLEVRAAGHVYADPHQCKELHGADRPSVGVGLWLTVDPDNLEWQELKVQRLYE
jgi:hypothetical protein